MITTGFEKTNGFWELQNWTRNGWEWVELQLQRFQGNLPEFPHWQTPRRIEVVLLWLALVIAGVGLVFLGEQVWRWGLRSLRLWRRYQAERQGTTVIPQPQRSLAEWLAIVQSFRDQGNFKEACRALYMALLQRLQDRQLIRSHLSWTDQEYLSQLQQLGLTTAPQTSLPRYETLLKTHERLCFSQTEISEQDFQSCYLAYESIVADTAEDLQPGR